MTAAPPASALPSPDRTPVALVGIVMGSRSDWATLERASQVLTQFGVAHECEIVSAHRTPGKLAEYATHAARRGLQLIIAGAGGAAHLPGMMAAQTALPVFGVPVESKALSGLDSLYSIVQMPAGIPVATVAIGNAKNAGLLAVQILGAYDPHLQQQLQDYRQGLQDLVLEKQALLEDVGYQAYLREMGNNRA